MNVPLLIARNPATETDRPVLTINVGMCQRDALLIPAGGCRDGHRGVWFYDPDKFGGPPIVGDLVRFTEFYSRVLACGRVTGIVAKERYPKYCSDLNHFGFTWADAPDDSRIVVVPEIESVWEQSGGYYRPGGWEHINFPVIV